MLPLLKALVVQDEALDEILAQNLCSPDAKLRRLAAVDTVSDGDDSVQIVEVHLAGDRPRPLDLNYPIFPDSCRFLQFASGKDVLEVLIDGSQVYAKEFCHLFLGQPEGLTLEQHLDAHGPVWRDIQDDLVVQWSLSARCHIAPPLHYSIYRKPTRILPPIWRQFCYN